MVLHKLKEKNLLDHISACNSLLKHNENVLFLKQIVTGNEKWILYSKVGWKRSWGKQNEPPRTTPKASLHPKKVILCIWWDWKGVLYYELLPENQMIYSNKYCSQLDQMKQHSMKKVWNYMTRRKLLQLSQEVLIHLPYSPDIATLDFHLFRSLQNSRNGKNFKFPGRL